MHRAKQRLSRLVLAALTISGFIATASATAQPVEQGRIAPADVAAKLEGSPSVVIGSVSVRPLRESSAPNGNVIRRPLAADAKGGTTYVARARDNLIGVSTNDLVVIYPDTAAIVTAAGAVVASAKPYPDIGMVVLHVTDFDQLEPLHRAIANRFPAAKFDLPVTYFPTRPR